MENVRILWLTKEKLLTKSEWIQIFSTCWKMQESGLLEIITFIRTLIRASNCCFCLKSVLWPTLLAASVTKDLIVETLFHQELPQVSHLQMVAMAYYLMIAASFVY